MSANDTGRMSIEERFDVRFVAELALREKQIQQNYRPIIAVHKWFARRPGTLFRSLILSEFCEEPLTTAFYTPHTFPNRTVADPFMGGGTPLLEANRLSCDVTGLDINPMAVWIVREEISDLDVVAYKGAAADLIARLDVALGPYYKTRCLICLAEVQAKYFLWVKVQNCDSCGSSFDLFPGYLLAQNVRHPQNILVCANCGALNEVSSLKSPSFCTECPSKLVVEGPAKGSKCRCQRCGNLNSYPRPEKGTPKHRMFAIEYYCAHCKPNHSGRFFKKPDKDDLRRFSEADSSWKSANASFVPSDEIPAGDETNRLHRWGYRTYDTLFNARQLLGLEVSCKAITQIEDRRIQRALSTNLSDLLRYQNMLCRYDTMALKSLDIFSIHGFPVGLVQCESNLLGIVSNEGKGVGSGGWANIVEKYTKAKNYCQMPFEVVHSGHNKRTVDIRGEWIGERQRESTSNSRKVSLHCCNAASIQLPPASLDAIFTDPPYFGNVQYAELMDFCYVWLRKLAGINHDGFDRASTRDAGELTGNVTLERGLDHFTEGLSTVFRKMASALRPGGPFVFTYHHNSFDAYYAAGVALLDAGLVCSASLPCPSEMGGSIHIHGTGSSVVDTVFVCRSSGRMRRDWLGYDAETLSTIVASDLGDLQAAGLKPSAGDVRCIVYGHLTRMTVWELRNNWDVNRKIHDRLRAFETALFEFPRVEDVIRRLKAKAAAAVTYGDLFDANRRTERKLSDAVSF